MKYRNFDLEVFDYEKTDTDERFHVRVMGSPVGEQRQAEADQVTISATLRQRVRQLANHDLQRSEIVALGKELANALFPPQVYALLGKNLVKLNQDEGLRIRLKLDTYALSDLPWEYVFAEDDFLVLNRRVSLVRYEILGQPKSTLSPVSSPPLRLVAVLANPRGTASLDLKTERKNIVEALKGIPIRPEFPGATMAKLLDALLTDAHIFHFSGHGRFNGDMGAVYGSLEGEGELILTGADGEVAAIPAEKIARIVADRGVRLAVLNACETGQRDQVNAWTGIAPALTRRGIPAVVALQFRIHDQNAIVFSRTFYRTLALGRSVDEAVTEGRIAIDSLGAKDESDWGVPVLYLRAEEVEGVLFPQPAPLSPSASGKSNSGSGSGAADTGQGSTGTDNGGITRPRLRPASDAANMDRRILREAMVQKFGAEDLAILCDDIQEGLDQDGIQLQVSLEVVGGSSKPAQVLNLIQYLDRRGYLGYLVAAVRRERPGLI